MTYPDLLLEILQKKKLNINELEFLYMNKEEFDFDLDQETYLFIQKNIKGSHNKLIIIRLIKDVYGKYSSQEETEFERRNLVRVM